MKKLISGMFNVFVYSNLLFALASATYISLPPEYQVFQGLDIHMILIGGGTTTLLGSAGLYFKHLLAKHDIEVKDTTNTALEKFLTLTKEYAAIKKENQDIKTLLQLLVNKQDHTNKLLETDLSAKLSNPLIDEAVKALIEGVLHEE
jgi:predicted amino acid-binding ACT domain protein